MESLLHPVDHLPVIRHFGGNLEQVEHLLPRNFYRFRDVVGGFAALRLEGPLGAQIQQLLDHRPWRPPVRRLVQGREQLGLGGRLASVGRPEMSKSGKTFVAICYVENSFNTFV